MHALKESRVLNGRRGFNKLLLLKSLYVINPSQRQPIIDDVHQDRIAVLEIAGQHLSSDGRLELPPDGSLERASPVDWIVPDVSKVVERLLTALDPHVLVLEPLVELSHLLLNDGTDGLLVEPSEDDELVQAVDELWAEASLHLVHDAHPHLPLCVRPPCEIQDVLRSDIRREDDDGVLEVHGPPLPIRHPPIVEDLQQHIENFRVCLLDLVKEDDRVRSPPHGLRQLTPFLVSHVARRGPEKT
mmetsp:Transcript_32097/g.102209  ORF Transcript_32097/g.102209 Transcript_32097/m.102209 type:complete len:244 (+) Transcript_32097:668-1399(+)